MDTSLIADPTAVDTHILPNTRKRVIPPYDDSSCSQSDDSSSDDETNTPPPKYNTRTCLQLAIGSSTFSVQVIIHLRVADLPWWNHPDSIASNHRQLRRIVQDQIIPNVDFEAEMIQRSSTQPRSNNNNKSMVVEVKHGEKNKEEKGEDTKGASRPQAKKTAKAPLKHQKHSKTTGGGKNKTKTTMTHHSSKVAPKRNKNTNTFSKPTTTNVHQYTTTRTKEEDVATSRKYNGDFRILMGESIQITYKLQPIADLYHSCTFIYDSSSEDDDDEVKESGNQKPSRLKLHTMRTLSQRIVLWCFPFDPNEPTKPIPFVDGGFPRQDMIPMASLFRFT